MPQLVPESCPSTSGKIHHPVQALAYCHHVQHLVAAGAIVRFQQDDFVGFVSGVDLAGMAQPDHVLGVVAPVFVTGAGLRHHEGLKPFLAQFSQHRGGGDIGVTLGTAFVGSFRKDGRGHAVNLVIGQRGVAAQYRGAGSETGCKQGLSPDKWVCCSSRTQAKRAGPKLEAGP